MRGLIVFGLAVAISRVALSESAREPDAALKHVTDAPAFFDSDEVRLEITPSHARQNTTPSQQRPPPPVGALQHVILVFTFIDSFTLHA